MIQFSYSLWSHGWARAFIGNGRVEVKVTASYLTDALGDFVDAVQRLFTEDRTECIWEEEPGEFLWKLHNEGVRCVVEVFQDGRVPEIFSGDDDLLHFGGEVEGAIQKLLDELGVEGYLKKWGHPFPQEAYSKLKQAIEGERKLRALNSKEAE
jgi:hypothetical protein